MAGYEILMVKNCGLGVMQFLQLDSKRRRFGATFKTKSSLILKALVKMEVSNLG